MRHSLFAITLPFTSYMLALMRLGVNFIQHGFVKTPATQAMRASFNWQFRGEILVVSPFCCPASGAAIVRYNKAHILYTRVGLKAFERDGGTRKFPQVRLAIDAKRSGVWRLGETFCTGLHVSASVNYFSYCNRSFCAAIYEFDQKNILQRMFGGCENFGLSADTIL
jgi:hypothetical protein